jgi:isopentenyl-diphosphate Delta-isomerase
MIKNSKDNKYDKELVDVFNSFNKPLNKKRTIKEAHEKGFWHRCVHIWVYTKKGEVLLQNRSNNMKLFPNLWDTSVAGHIRSGEEPIYSAIREIKEEIGIKISRKDLNFFKILKRENNHKDFTSKEFYYIYFLEFNKNKKELKRQKSEVKELKFIKISDFKKELKTIPEKFVPHKRYYNQIIKRIEEIIKK